MSYCTTSQERKVRRLLNEYYGSRQVDHVETMDADEYRAILFDGTVVLVSREDSGEFSSQEVMAGC